MIDQKTFDRYMDAVTQARKLSLPIQEVLDREHLLLTQRRRHDVEIDTLQDLYRRIERQTPNKLMSFYYGRVEGTPEEMFRAVLMWVDAVIRNQANGTLQEL